MRAYKICPKSRRSAPVWILDSTNTLINAFEEFKKTYGIGSAQPTEPFRYYTMLANARLGLYRDKKRLNLACNPLVDDLSSVFAEWIIKKPGFKRVENREAEQLQQTEEFSFPY